MEKLKEILLGSSLESKLIPISSHDWQIESFTPIDLVASPGMPHNQKGPRLKFPSLKALEKKSERARALHFFANHELQAIHMFAMALLMFPNTGKEMHRFKQGIMKALQDEQKHFSLYLHRMREFGLEFGDLQTSDFFWKQMQNVRTPETFTCIMALTLENANLDFSRFYRDFFQGLGDTKTSSLLSEVYEDEIDHVRLGAIFLKKKFYNKPLVQLYQEILPFPLTPSRAKGNYFDRQGREKAGFSEDFIDFLFNYKDSFKVTQRKAWRHVSP